MRTALAVGLLLCGCVRSPVEAAIRRGSVDLECPRKELTLTLRPDLSPDTIDVEGCGLTARYTCVQTHDDHRDCIREPLR